MKTQVQTLEPCKAKLTIEFESADSSKAYSFALKDASKGLRVPGFMPGKIPRAMIEERVGKQSIQMRAIEKLLSDSLPKALSNEKLDLISRPVLENTNFDFDNTLNVSLIVELRPIVVLGDYKDIAVDVPKSELKGVSVDTLLVDLSKQLAPWTEITEDAKVAMDDLITMDFDGKFIDGSEMPDGEGRSIRMIVRPENFAPNVIDQLIGAEIGETREVKTAFPAGYENPEFAGKDAIFTVTVSKIERKLPLEVNEELAAKAGQPDLESLKKALEAQIESTKTNIVKSRSQALVLEKVLSSAHVDIPEWLIEREAKAQMEHDHHDHHHHNGSECNHNHEEEPSEELVKFSTERLKFNLVLAEIARKENIAVSQDELTAYVQSWLRYRQMSDPSFDPKGNISPALVNHLSEELLFQKITDWLVEKAKVNSVEESEDNLKKLEEVKKAFPSLAQEH